MNPTEIRQRVLPVLQEYFGVAAEFVLDDVLAAIPQSNAFDQRLFLFAFQAALRREIPPGTPADPIVNAAVKALSSS
jgi:hypothetical protein